MYKEGSWVEIKHHNAKGYVLESDDYGALVCVIKNGKAEGEKRFSHHQLDRADSELLSEDAKALTHLHINMALDSEDKSWFHSLTDGSMEESK
ncbi:MULTISPECIES: hypothetical protein [Bacillaceae]|uniref:hypothetical protein n=1 Tax=Bacillaceae TaxID=186817 RepID=UPI000E72712F|nr:hypothetical protein [Bacillus sp. PK3_68]RJS59438.1 hypothetical protein CJ483_04735 [Bacillus sp. PK3_68]